MERRYYLILTFLWTILITTLSLVSFTSANLSLVTVKNSDKLVHFCFYFVLTLLLLKSFSPKSNYKYLIVIVLAVSYGIVIEVLQSKFTLNRKGDFYDVIANTTGVIGAVLLNKYLFTSISSNIIKKN